MTDEAGDRRAAGAPGSDELLRLVVESATDFAILATDPAGCVTSWNIGAERVLGFTEDEILGVSADIIFTPEDRLAGIPDEERRLALADGRALDERWTMRKDGSRFWASGLMMPLTDHGLGFVKIFRDRTEQHRAEAELREKEERFRLLATNIPQLVFRTQPDGDRTWASPQWIDFTGLGFEESLGQGWLDAVHPDDREETQAAWAEARRTGEYYVEHRVRRASDSAYRWHQTRVRRVENDAQQSLDWVGTMTDIHDLRGLQDRQQVLVAELQHRTRNLLAVVQAIASQTRRRSDSLDTFETEFGSRLRALGRVQALLARFEQHNVDLRELVVTELGAHGAEGLTADRMRVEGPSVALPPDAAQALGLALHELATNAIKHGALSQPTGRLEVTWQEMRSDGGRRVVLEWTENGIAMANDRPRRKGYGSELIERALPYQLGAETRLEFGPDGIRCTIGVPVRSDVAEMEHG
ncbi:MAG: sensor histidine kinase [Alphaproteobacteria bacterium]